MAMTRHGVPGTQGEPLPVTAAQGGGAVPPAAPPGPGWHPAPPPRRSRGLVAAVGAAIVLAIAALVVGIADLTRSPAAPPVAAAPSSASPAPSSTPTDPAAADRALCTAIAPLMTESNRSAKAYSNSGAGTTGPKNPDQEAATTKFINDTKVWFTRIQPLIDSHPDADPYFRRSLQRFVDDLRYFVADIEAGPFQPYDQTIWNDSLGAGTGPLNVCWGLGVKW